MGWGERICCKNRDKYVGTKTRRGKTAGSTEKNESDGLSTERVAGRRMATVIGSWWRFPEQKGMDLIAPVGRFAARERSRTRGNRDWLQVT